MKRCLKFTDKESIDESLGVSSDRWKYICGTVNFMIESNVSIYNIIDTLNNKEDFNDAEWTSVVFLLGRFSVVNLVKEIGK